jgi:hypothetical protein
MTEELLNYPQVSATVQEVSGKAVAQHVGEYPFIQTCPKGIP